MKFATKLLAGRVMQDKKRFSQTKGYGTGFRLVCRFARTWLSVFKAIFMVLLAILPASHLFAASNPDTVCAVVKIEINQSLSLERQAFYATMRISNALDSLPLENLKINVNFTDENGAAVIASSNPDDVGAVFFIKRELPVGAYVKIDGTGVVMPKTTEEIRWLIIPAPGSALGVPEGKLYFVGAQLDYTLGGEPKTTTVTPDSIYVKPLPLLSLDYFLTKDIFADDAFTATVEPPVPFTLGVRVRNSGAATAKNVIINSAQPRIIENEEGLLVGFNIIGSYVNDVSFPESLKVNLGTIPPGRASVGRWDMVTTLSGRFTDFTATFSHSDELGGELTSILQGSNAYYLVHNVSVEHPGKDKILDFLAYPVGEPSGVLTVYESDNVNTPVINLSQESMLVTVDGKPNAYYLKTLEVPGYMYVKLADPTGGSGEMKSVIRSDGKYLSSHNFWSSKTRNLDTTPPSWNYWINIFDTESTGLYTIFTGGISVTPVAPVLAPLDMVTTYETNPVSFTVSASDVNNDPLSITVSTLPPGAVFVDNGNGTATFSWAPALGDAGEYQLTFTAMDILGLSSKVSTTIKVNPEWDTDGDGMDDAWEIANFGDLSRDGTGDLDGDGVSDYNEYLANTDPTMVDGMAQPIISMPAVGAEVIDLQPTLTVSNSITVLSAPITYDFEVFSDAAMTRLIASVINLAEGSGTTSWKIGIALSDNTHYYWRVRATDGKVYSLWTNGDFFVNTANDAPVAPTLSAPAASATVDTFLPTLVVNNTTDVDNDVLTYGFEIFSDAGMTTLVASTSHLVEDGLGVTRWMVDMPLAEDTEYYWRATVTDEHGLATASTVSSFFVSTTNAAPESPVIIGPAGGETETASSVLLSVNNAVDVDSSGLLYYFDIDTVSTFDSTNLQSSGAVTEGTDTTTWAVSGLTENTTYYWRVKASDGLSDSAWTQTTFTVSALNNPPADLSIQNPGDGAWVASLTPVLSVNPTTDPDGDTVLYEFQLYADAAMTNLLSSAEVATPSWTVDTALTINTTYYWRARAKDAASAASAWTAISRFIVTDNDVDLTVTGAVSSLATINGGETFTVNVTTANVGGSPAATSTYTRLYLSADTTLDSNDVILGSTYVAALNATTDSNRDITLTLSTAIPAGSYYLLAKADYDDRQPENIEDNNVYVGGMVTVVQDVDLQVTNLSVSATTINGGDSFTISITTENQGTSQAGTSTYTRIYISPDPVITTEDRVLATSRVTNLAAAGADSQDVTVLLPEDLASGTYYIGAIADFDHRQSESDENNNIYLGPTVDGITIAVVQDVDLVVTALTPSATTVNGGETFTVAVTTTNQGTSQSPTYSYSRIYLSTDAILDPNDKILGTVRVYIYQVGGSVENTMTITMPPGVEAGNYYLLGEADATNAISESNETNNILAGATVTVVQDVDLTVTSVVPTITSINGGQSFDVAITTVNQGNSQAPDYSYSRVYLSSDTVLDASDKILGTARVSTLKPGISVDNSVTITMPASIAAGSYYLLGVADDTSSVTETDEANNILVGSTVTVVQEVDLRVTRVVPYVTSIYGGQSFDVAISTVNQGNSQAAAYSYSRIYLSSDAVLDSSDKILGTARVTTLKPGTSADNTVTITMPASIAAGDYYLLGVADDTATITETDESNNVLVGPTVSVVQDVDLVTTAPSPSITRINGGQSLTVAITTINQGNSQSPVYSYSRIYLSSDTVLDASDRILGTARVTTLKPGISADNSVTITMPASIAAGNYYLLGVADDTKTVLESDEVNNVTVGPSVTVVQAVDLVIKAINSNIATVNIGESLTLSITTVNQGSSQAPAYSYSRFYLSADTVLDSSDKILSTVRVGTLKPGTSADNTLTVTVPSSVTEGSYYLLGVADDTKTVSETDETNNVLVGPGITVIQAMDLVITSLSPSISTINGGQSFNVSITTENQDTSFVTAYSYSRIYLSSDSVLDASDKILGTARVGYLQPGGGNTTSNLTLTMPASIVAGNYYLLGVADDTGTIEETNENNNVMIGPAVTVIQDVDLVVSNLAASLSSVSAGGTISVDTITHNQGSSQVPGYSYTRVYLSTDTVLDSSDKILGTVRIGTLQAGASYSGTSSLTIPSTTTAGDYYLLGVADDTRAVNETNESNNTFIGQVLNVTAP